MQLGVEWGRVAFVSVFAVSHRVADGPWALGEDAGLWSWTSATNRIASASSESTLFILSYSLSVSFHCPCQTGC